MKIKVIYAATQTTLTIVTPNASEVLSLDQMGSDGTPVRVRTLRAGVSTTVPVGPGVYKILSDAVRVTADTADVTSCQVATIDNKDDPPADPPIMAISFDKSALRTFLVDSRGEELRA